MAALPDQLTIVIPTYRRPRCLTRLLAYLPAAGNRHAIVVADSSPEPDAASNREAAARAGVAYRHFPSDIRVFRKLAETVAGLTSRLAVICADDDFMVPATLDACAQFLDDHPDYAIAHGLSVTMARGAQDSGLFDGVRTGGYRQCTIELDDPLARVEQHLASYATTMYSVHRREQLCANAVLAEATEDYRFGEVLPSALSLVQGKAKQLDRLGMVREMSEIQTSRNPAEVLMPEWGRVVTSPRFSERYGRFRQALVDELAVAGTRDAEAAGAAVDRGFALFLARHIDRPRGRPARPPRIEAVRRRWVNVRDMVRAIFQEGPLGKAVREPGRALAFLASEAENDMGIGRLLATGSGFRDDLMPIYRAIAEAE